MPVLYNTELYVSPPPTDPVLFISSSPRAIYLGLNLEAVLDISGIPNVLYVTLKVFLGSKLETTD